jgi:predicted Zn-dependent peptidase
VILAGAPLPLTGRDDTLPLRLANDLFGGLATSRLNRLLREEKGWTYGAFSGVRSARLELPFLLSAPVETPRTGDSIAAIRTLLAEFRGKNPPAAAELDRARAALVRSLPGDFETGSAFLGALERNVVLDRPDDYLATLPARTEAVTLDAVRAAPLPAPEDLVFIIVGDRAAVEPQIKALGLAVEHRMAPAPAAAAPRPTAAPPATTG